jgi:large subunit ribosomal protein L22|tara:strand:- start:17389 stop:17787 length:399 start_codon:yes stop_codon:yes gene_type:complete
MGARKKIQAENLKEANKEVYSAQLRNCPTSPRKMRLVADMIRGVQVEKASFLLQFSKKEAAKRVEKLLWSAINNYEQKSGNSWESANLSVKEIFVDSGRMLKRVQPAPQGRAHRIRKRSNHVTVVLESTIKE